MAKKENAIHNMKDAARKTILHYYRESGLDVALGIAQEIITEQRSVAKDMNLPGHIRGHLKGELAEVVLELFLMDYVAQTPGTFVVKGLIVPFQGTKSGFTELDLTLFTPSSIHMFEAKSYDGVCTLTKECNLRSNSGSATDVYAQSKLHLDALDHWIEAYITTKKVYRLCLFSFADNEVTDKRDEKFQLSIPFLDETSIEDYIHNIDVKADRVDMNKVYKVIRGMNEKRVKNTEKHLAGVQGK